MNKKIAKILLSLLLALLIVLRIVVYIREFRERNPILPAQEIEKIAFDSACSDFIKNYPEFDCKKQMYLLKFRDINEDIDNSTYWYVFADRNSNSTIKPRQVLIHKSGSIFGVNEYYEFGQ